MVANSLIHCFNLFNFFHEAVYMSINELPFIRHWTLTSQHSRGLLNNIGPYFILAAQQD